MPSDTEHQNDATDTQAEDERNDALPAGLDEGAKAVIAKEREARKLAAKDARDAKAERDALLKEKADREKAQQDADEQKAVEQGEYKTLAEKRADDVKAVTGERDALKTKLDILTDAIKPDVDAKWAALPDEITEIYAGDGDDVIAKRQFMTTHAKLIEKLSDKQDADKQALKTPLTPRPNTNLKPGDEEARRGQASIYRNL